MVREGFTIGLHGISHDYKKFYRSEESLMEEMKQDQKIVRSIAQHCLFVYRMAAMYL
ncbi:hypothetical protein [Sporolactobacillus sp. KGMB 08714]|uniref:hypothetical protein n=1 Tax=Sporolactobacillus sp. KGMB 08714 TaxID=3064704 RepID=UPI003FA78EDF